MSQKHKQSILIPTGVVVDIKGKTIRVKGPKGELVSTMHPSMVLQLQDSNVSISPVDIEAKEAKAFTGLTYSLVSNMVQGVTTGFSKSLEINGVGYKVLKTEKGLVFHLGYSHSIDFDLPINVTAEITKNILTLSGIDKQLIGDLAAQIRKLRKVEPYKGNGIKYVGEVVIRKAGKLAKGTGAGK